jgi:hypothetical protein
MRRFLACSFLGLFCSLNVFAQSVPRQIPAKRTHLTIKIDGNPDEAAWKEAVPATDFIEWRPNAGKKEDSANRTVVYILYDNTSVYVGGYCYERTKDSISKELVGRDVVGVNDFVGVLLDTYNDKINGVGFYVTPYGEQFDAKYSNTGNNMEDPSWNSVWDSEAKIHDNGWSFEMRIPYSALRFSNRPNQTWGLNITRRRNKTGQQYMWNPIDPKVNGLMNQEGLWAGIEKVEAPLRLSFSPYFSSYLNHYPNKTPGVKDWHSSVNGGMDVKYGISEGFTLDMTLIPDFGQVQSDNHILNLSPFEVKYNENRSFFTEGTELFNKGNLFYSRRIGSQPIHYYDVQDSTSSYAHINPGETLLKNPQESKLLNATKISGRTKNGLGIGFLNAVTKPMYAEAEDKDGKVREIETSPLTNYNIVVLDQTLKNNSSVSFINTNVLRSGSDYDANVSAALFTINNKKNTYNWNGKFALSQLTNPTGKNTVGYSHNLGFGKTGGRWNFQLAQELADEKYNINDMGILFNNNYIDHMLWTGYRWLTPGSWYNRIQVNYNLYYSRLYSRFADQKVSSMFQSLATNVNANAQLKNLWFVGGFIGYMPEGNNFYEPHQTGRSFKSTERVQYSAWFQTNAAKKYYVEFNYFGAAKKLFNGLNHEINLSHRYRFDDKFSITHDLYLNPSYNDAGYYFPTDASGNQIAVEDILFTRRNRMTVENVLRFKYNFNYRSGITFRARHYWSQVEQKELFDLQADGSLLPTRHTTVPMQDKSTNFFNIDAVYTLQFAPGSFLNIVWKDESFLDEGIMKPTYFGNFSHTMEAPQNNTLSIKLIYYLDYLDFKKWKKKG